MLLKENEFSWFSKAAIYIIIIIAVISALMNIFDGIVVQPECYKLILVGMTLFLISKLKVISTGTLISYGTKQMSNFYANLYRLGYWFMIVGILSTFAG